MRGADPPVQYLVGTPKGRLTRLEKDLLAKPWQQARPGVRVKLLPRDGELYVFADSAKLGNVYLLRVRVEEAFKSLKGDLAIRPIFHQDQAGIEAHIFIAFLAYCLHATLA